MCSYEEESSRYNWFVCLFSHNAVHKGHAARKKIKSAVSSFERSRKKDHFKFAIPLCMQYLLQSLYLFCAWCVQEIWVTGRDDATRTMQSASDLKITPSTKTESRVFSTMSSFYILLVHCIVGELRTLRTLIFLKKNMHTDWFQCKIVVAKEL